MTRERVCFGSCHGKGPCDAAGGVVKTACRRAVIREQAIINNAITMYDYLKSHLTRHAISDNVCNHSRRKFFLVGDINHDRPERMIKITLKGTRKIDAIRTISPGVISTRNLFCTCASCLSGDGSRCSNTDHVEPWTRQQLSLVVPYTPTFPEFIVEDLSERQAEDGSDRQAEDGSERQAEDGSERQAEDGSERQAEDGSERQAEDGSERQAEDGSERQAEDGSERQAEDGSDRQAEDGSDRQAEDASERQAEDGSERQAEDGSEREAEDHPILRTNEVEQLQPTTEVGLRYHNYLFIIQTRLYSNKQCSLTVRW